MTGLGGTPTRQLHVSLQSCDPLDLPPLRRIPRQPFQPRLIGSDCGCSILNPEGRSGVLQVGEGIPQHRRPSNVDPRGPWGHRSLLPNNPDRTHGEKILHRRTLTPELPVAHSEITADKMEPGDVARLTAGNEMNDCYSYRVALPGGWILGLDDASSHSIGLASTWDPSEGTYHRIGQIQTADLQCECEGDLTAWGATECVRKIVSVVWPRVRALMGLPPEKNPV